VRTQITLPLPPEPNFDEDFPEVDLDVALEMLDQHEDTTSNQKKNNSPTEQAPSEVTDQTTAQQKTDEFGFSEFDVEELQDIGH
jgi:hypothetical protein